MIATGGISGGVGNNIQAFAKDQVLSSFYVYQQGMMQMANLLMVYM
jgi:hypothetical protein